MFEHRKYHWLWFLLGMMIAIILGTLMGCEGGTGSGVIKEEPPVQCCMALTPECYAQCESIPVDVWIENTCGVNAISAEYYGWNEELNEPIWLCQAEGIPNWAAE